jgi:hypothetical protein
VAALPLLFCCTRRALEAREQPAWFGIEAAPYLLTPRGAASTPGQDSCDDDEDDADERPDGLAAHRAPSHEPNPLADPQQSDEKQGDREDEPELVHGRVPL